MGCGGLAEANFLNQLVELTSVPLVTTWGAVDILKNDHPLYVGTFGTHGQRHANFAVQNS